MIDSFFLFFYALVSFAPLCRAQLPCKAGAVMSGMDYARTLPQQSPPQQAHAEQSAGD